MPFVCQHGRWNTDGCAQCDHERLVAIQEGWETVVDDIEADVIDHAAAWLPERMPYRKVIELTIDHLQLRERSRG